MYQLSIRVLMTMCLILIFPDNNEVNLKDFFERIKESPHFKESIGKRIPPVQRSDRKMKIIKSHKKSLNGFQMFYL